MRLFLGNFNLLSLFFWLWMVATKTLTVINEVRNFRREHKRVFFSFISKLLFFVFQKMTKINVEEVSLNIINHNVVRMPISKSQNVRSYTIARRTPDKYLSDVVHLI